MEKATIYKIIAAVCSCIMAIAAACLCTGCNVTRTITTTSQSLQRGDTAITIMTRTVESYDATKKASL